jgi:hypothetical protein
MKKSYFLMSRKLVVLTISKFDPPTLSDMAICSEVLRHHPGVSEYWYAPYGNDDDTPIINRVEMLSMAIADFFPECRSIKICNPLVAKIEYKASLWSNFISISQLNPQYEFNLVMTSEDFIKETALLDENSKLLAAQKIIMVGKEASISMQALVKIPICKLVSPIINAYETRKWLHEIDRNSTFDSCKVLSLIPKIVLQYIILHKHYL